MRICNGLKIFRGYKSVKSIEMAQNRSEKYLIMDKILFLEGISLPITSLDETDVRAVLI